MQQLDPILLKLKFHLLDDYKPIAKYFTNPQAKLSTVTFIAFVIITFCTLIDFAPRILIGVVGTLIPAIQAINKYVQQGEIYSTIPYFLIFSTYIAFQGILLKFMSFIPFLNTICLFFVVALYHPDVQLANRCWDMFQHLV